jgi:Fe-S-cluster containining protein
MTDFDKRGQTADLPASIKDKRQLAPDEEFTFGCHKGVPCFTDCCANVNIMLTPLDVLGLSRHTGMSTTDFLENHTLKPITKDLHLPVVMLRMEETEEKKCPFVGPEGCTVYEGRPWACRMYPIGMAIPPARAGYEPEPIYFLFEDDYCKGHAEKPLWTVNKWRDDQGLVEREKLEEGFRGIVSHPWFIGGRQLPPAAIEMFFNACYDLDKFRSFIFDTSFLERFELEEDLIETLRTNDEALLDFGIVWLRYALFQEPTITVRPGAEEKAKAKAKALAKQQRRKK